MPAVSAHCLLPISTSLEQQRANAKISSWPVNMELEPTTSLDNPRSSITLRIWSDGALEPCGGEDGLSEKILKMGTAEVVRSFVLLS